MAVGSASAEGQGLYVLISMIGRRRPRNKYFFTAFQKHSPVHHYDTAATCAFDLNIGACTDNGPFIAAAWMGFASLDAVSQPDILHVLNLQTIVAIIIIQHPVSFNT